MYMEKHRKRTKARTVRLSESDDENLTEWLELSGMNFQTFAELAILSYTQQNPNPQYLREEDYDQY